MRNWALPRQSLSEKDTQSPYDSTGRAIIRQPMAATPKARNNIAHGPIAGIAGGAGVMVNGIEPVIVPKLNTANCAVPAVVNRLAGTVAVSWFGLTTVVGSVVVPPPGAVH
jgi:hypothetical protein